MKLSEESLNSSVTLSAPDPNFLSNISYCDTLLVINALIAYLNLSNGICKVKPDFLQPNFKMGVSSVKLYDVTVHFLFCSSFYKY